MVDPELMDMKFKREKDFLKMLDINHKEIIPPITKINNKEKKIYFKIEGDDFWEQSHGKKYEDGAFCRRTERDRQLFVAIIAPG